MRAIHSKVVSLADRLGVRLSDRSVSESHIWNGRDIGTSYQRFSIEDDVIMPEKYRMQDAEILHEIGHWVAAVPWLRDLPEYGMTWPTWSHGAYGSREGGSASPATWEVMLSGLLSESAQRAQEAMAQVLTWEWMTALELQWEENTKIATWSQGVWNRPDGSGHIGKAIADLETLGHHIRHYDVWSKL